MTHEARFAGPALTDSVYVQISALIAALILILHSALTRRWLVPTWVTVAIVCMQGGRSSGLGFLLVVPLGLAWLLSLGSPDGAADAKQPRATVVSIRSLSIVSLLLVVALHATASTLLTSSSWLPAANLGALMVVATLTNAMVRGSGRVPISRQIELLGFATALVYLTFVATRLSQAGVGSWTKIYAESSWLNSNSLGATFLLCASVPLARAARGEVTGATIVTSLTMAAACLATFSRSALLGLATLVLIMVARRARLVVPLGTVTALLILRPPAALADRLSYTFQGGQLDPSSSARFGLWRAAWEAGVNSPFLGVGLPNLGKHLGVYAETSGIQYAHNSYLTVFAAFGLPVFAMGLVLVVSLLHRLVTLQSADRSPPSLAALGAACGLAMASFFGEPLLAPPVVCVVVALVSSAIHERVNA